MFKILGLHTSKWSLLLLAGDVGVFALSGLLVLAWIGPGWRSMPVWFSVYLPGLALYLGINLLVLYVADLYDQYQDYRSAQNISRLIFAVWLATLLGVWAGGASSRWQLERISLEWQAVGFAVGLSFWRFAFSALALPTRLQRRLAIIGAGQAGRHLLQMLRARPNSGLEVVGFMDDDPGKAGAVIDGLPVLGDTTALAALAKEHRLDFLVLAITRLTDPVLLNRLSKLAFNSVQLLDLPTVYEYVAGKLPMDYISENWLLIHSIMKNKTYYRHVKRLLDLVLAAVLLAVTWPLLLLIGLAIRLDSPGPALFQQARLGQDGREFIMFKFRSMVQDAERQGPQFASSQDDRITRVGRFLRHTRLDELPQLFNILKGEMSFIGPRPERRHFIEQFQEMVPDYRPGRRQGDPPGTQVVCGYRERLPYYSYRLVVKPGITGWGQVMYGYAGSLEETREKLQYDLYYIKNMNFFLDLTIFLKTIRIILLGRGK